MFACLQSPQEGRINLAINKNDLKQVKNIFLYVKPDLLLKLITYGVV